jgi:hypothetical protein
MKTKRVYRTRAQREKLIHSTQLRRKRCKEKALLAIEKLIHSRRDLQTSETR